MWYNVIVVKRTTKNFLKGCDFMTFVNKMYLFKYLKGIGADIVALGFPLCGSHDVCVIFLSKADFVNIQRGYFEKLSPACSEYMKKIIKSKKSDIHYRFTFKAKELQFLAMATGNSNLESVCTAERFEQIKTENSEFLHQKNAGYALERVVYEMFGLEWSWKHKGCDLQNVEFDGQMVNIEIKWFNGQAKV